ncbi:DinB family protein [Aureliella helgolandensis]|uniref:DinB superfamily protein n=1 Tax=Aureliella helgolandensis TaxID=2527968 RepID=A0A518G7V9_9BACT|nr:DinB family protein [Aureliella helgolandensis]QDV24674.1 DinB superfamily protein [Aureliella helgolandensis]
MSWNSQQFILEDLNLVHRYTLDMLSHVEDGLWFKQPQPGINTIAWQVGHIALVRYRLCLGLVRGESAGDSQLLPIAEYSRMFGKGSMPAKDPVAEYPSAGELRESLLAVHRQVMEEVPQLAESVLAEPCNITHPLFSTKGQAMRFCSKHEMLHVGQIGLLRRLLHCEIIR